MNIHFDLSKENFDLLEQIESRHEARWISEFVQKKSLNDPSLSKSLENEICLRRFKGEPLAYILGEWPFAEADFAVGPGALIPRPETEELAYWISDWVNEKRVSSRPPLVSSETGIFKVADFGAGTGCLGLGICRLIELNFQNKMPTNFEIELHLVEKSSASQNWLIENVSRFQGLLKKTRVHVHASDWNDLPALPSLDVLVSNPPYLSTHEWENIEPGVRDFEPVTSLLPHGTTGLSPLKCYEEIMNWVNKSQLKQPRLIAFEGGPSQGPDLLQRLSQLTKEPKKVFSVQDMAGKPRFYFVERGEE